MSFFPCLKRNQNKISTPNPTSTICIIIPVTSHKHETEWTQLSDSLLYKMPLTSLSKSLNNQEDIHLNAYKYKLFVGYDVGDPFYDNQTTLTELDTYASQNLNPLFITLEPRAILNTNKQPGTAFNYLSNEAYKEDCDFMYHIDDDTEFITPNWAKPFVSALQNLKPPFFGVVGPTCHEGNTAILTHNFVHRSHLDRFSTYYPPELSSWWFDNWISEIYGKSNTLKIKDVLVKDHPELAMRHGLRYKIIWDSSDLLRPLIAKAQQHLLDLFLDIHHNTFMYIE